MKIKERLANFLHHTFNSFNKDCRCYVDIMNKYTKSSFNNKWFLMKTHWAFTKVTSSQKMQKKTIIYHERIQKKLMWLTYLVVPQYSISASFTRATLHPIQIPVENETLTQIILGINDIHYSADLAWRNGMETFWIILPIITASRRVQFLSCS